MNLSFEKWHGAKNNFIVCHLFKNDDYLLESLKKSTQSLCTNDGSGIGSDGILILYYKNSNDTLPMELMILNSDGSIAQTCGNGIRCAVSSLRGRILKTDGICPEIIELKVSGRNYFCRFDSDGSVNINMGICLGGEKVKNFAEKNSFVQMKLEDFSIDYNSLGIFNISNEHVVIELNDLDKDRLFKFAQNIQESKVWDGINVHFIKEKKSMDLTRIYNKKVDSAYEVLVWERGVGPTAACGSGACSIGKFIFSQGFNEEDSWLEISMPGGNLYTKLEGEEMLLAGKCNKVFTGDIEI